MRRSHGIKIEKAVSILFKEINVDFKELFIALGKAVLDASGGGYGSALGNVLSSIKSFKIKDDVNQLAWTLVYRSTCRAIIMLVKENEDRIRSATKGFTFLANKTKINKTNTKKIAEQLDYNISAKKIVLDSKFFNNPRNFPVLEDLKKPLAEWLEHFGLDKVQAKTISERLPSYFPAALDDELRDGYKNDHDYRLIVEQLFTPATEAAETESDFWRYYVYLRKKIDEPVFGQTFGLRQVFVPLRAYHEEKSDKDSRQVDIQGQDFRYGREKKKIVVDLQSELEKWVKNNNKRDSIRVLRGGPGYGKSSVSKMFAATQSETGSRRVLFIALHLFKPKEDLQDALKEFIKNQGFFSRHDLLEYENDEKFLLIFDGLDELTMQGKVGNEVAKKFAREVRNFVESANASSEKEPRFKVLICGRDIAVQAGEESLSNKTKILHLLPYYITEDKRKEFSDPDNLLEKDQRNDWWKKYGKVTKENYKKLPDELSQDNLTEINSLPLLNFLIAQSYDHGKIDFTKEPNLNEIYYDLMKSVYDRDWDENDHPMTMGVREEDFFRIFEDIAIAAWYTGEARRVTVREIEKVCERSGLKPLLDKFKKMAEDGVSSLLLAFYFKESGMRSEEMEKTFEFTHKSFGEYLIARKIVKGIKRMCDEIKRREESYESGWDKVDALKYWTELCGKTQIDGYLRNFINNEVASEYKKSEKEVAIWQNRIAELFAQVLRHSMPIERIDPEMRKTFKEDVQLAKNAEETLLVTLNACSMKIGKITDEDIFKASNNENSALLNDWLRWVHTSISRDSFLHLPLSKINLSEANLSEANLSEANLSGANLNEARLSFANLIGTNLNGVNLSFAIWTNGKKIIGGEFPDFEFVESSDED